MSKYLGKLLLEGEGEDESGYEYVRESEVRVRYIKGREKFLFECAGYKFELGKKLVLDLVSEPGTLPIHYMWSTGYKVRPKKGVEYLKSLRSDELALLGGRKELIEEGELMCDDDFDLVCVIQYEFNLSKRKAEDIMRNRDKEPVTLTHRKTTKRGRKTGCKLGHWVNGTWVSAGSEPGSHDEELREEVLRVCQHNKKVARLKNRKDIYVSACKEECKILGKKFDELEVNRAWSERGRE